MRSKHIRQELAHLAARLVAVDGIHDYLIAKRKAAARMGVNNQQQLPSNEEIEQALADYQRLFQADTQPRILQHQRQLAARAMEMFTPFKPRLAGAVADGIAGEYSEIHLHLYADAIEDIAFELFNRQIPYESCERRIRLNAATVCNYPAYRFLAEGQPIVLIIFPLKDRNQSPLSSTDGRAMQRLTLAELNRLLDTDVGNGPSVP